MSFTAEELEEMRLADEEIEREFEESCSAQYKRHRRAYYEAHKDEIAASRRAYYEAHKDEIAAYQRAYREAHKDEAAAYQRAYQREYRKRKRMNAEIKNAAPDTAMSESGM